jgi:hypothetical protein
LAQYLIVPPQFSVVAAAAGRLFADRASHSGPFTTVRVGLEVNLRPSPGWLAW